ncbi:DNA repair protein RecN [Caprobacter fermentans]|uniref:DNA repair protein RecN n=1 Tax=Caproicibacter fermentans TaxID=2576756 RepID=A0A6N8I2F7_9FIRM|nr:DNA repair protein RecN [Caproicibacter fermentans]MVB11947.1 DNA repair protein RecN [Caproicibacter fermentans]OCM99907.1 DNA repair protein RecN [Clostridium sp. W14A]QNK41179.1 DNA repair protein RecN [Caproicibacter fermentans]
MLTQLYIENIAVIEKARIEFGAGFNVLTGETGAGKSIVIDSINAVLGERTSRELIRTGADHALVSAVFELKDGSAVQKLEESGYSVEEDGTLILQREISSDGKSSCRINARPATVSALKGIGSMLINIHGQHESYGLLSPELHIAYLDSMGLPEALLKRYREAFHSMQNMKASLDSSKMDQSQKARQIDLLTYQINELESANLHPGEQEDLNRQKNLYRNSERVAQAISQAKTALSGDEETAGAVSAVSDAADALNTAENYLPELHGLAERLQAISYDLEDCSDEMRNFSSLLEYDPSELDEIEARLDLIYRLSLKYGGSVDEMLEYLEKCRQELNAIQLSDENAEKFRKEYQKYRLQAESLATELSEWRAGAADLFTQKVKEELRFLNMPNVLFEIRREQVPMNETGCDRIEFYLSTNAGEPAKPIAKVASGGELSRIMLAIKTVLAGRDDIGTLIFDEVDTGVSGSAAQKVGLKLREVSGNRQVICVTHLAQIAALADTHFLIRKQVRNQRTFTQVDRLDREGRRQELARIMGGEQITPLMLQNAEEMLRMAQNDSSGS